MGLDISSLLLLLAIQWIELIFLLLIKGAHLALTPAFFLGLTLWGIGELLDLAITIYFYAILIYAVLSWVPQTGYNPLLLLLVQIINPVLRTIQRYIKPIGGLDLSPWFLIILLQVMVFLFVHPCVNYGIQLSLS
jgi:YggT family protein